ncbi:TetR/AcrR family transcriptional regulator [Mycobacterium sp. NPDC003449]
MARPKVPLISKRKALETALKIIDTEGIAALSIRRLAVELDVNGASLYYHFRNKEEIVVGAARLALADVHTPATGDQPWRVWILRNCRALRKALIEHPDSVPVMLRMGALQINRDQVAKTVDLLQKEGVPIGAIVPMMEALELYAVANALQTGSATADMALIEHESVPPNVRAAYANRALSSDEVFDKVCGHIIDTIVSIAAERATSIPVDAPDAELAKPLSRKRSPAKSQAAVVAGRAGTTAKAKKVAKGRSSRRAV